MNIEIGVVCSKERKQGSRFVSTTRSLPQTFLDLVKFQVNLFVQGEKKMKSNEIFDITLV